MNNKLVIALIALLLALPAVLADIKIQLGAPYVNLEDFSDIKFSAHSDYYEFCASDSLTIPVLIRNDNKFSDTLSFTVDKEYASLPVSSAALKSGKSVILPLKITPPFDTEENTSLVLGIVTKQEGLKRKVMIKTNIRECYIFELESGEEDICGCDEIEYGLLLQNSGEHTKTFSLVLDAPEWVNLTLTNESINLAAGQKKEIKLQISPQCDEKGAFDIDVGLISQNGELIKDRKFEIDVVPEKTCYNTIISAKSVSMDYLGNNILIKMKNKGVKDEAYSLSVEGADWYTLSHEEFTLKKGEEKKINLALHPTESVVEGEYNLDINAKSDYREYTKSITVKLKKEGVFLSKVRFYVNYFKYYILAGVILLIVILLLLVLINKRKKSPKKKEENIEKEEKVTKEEKKASKTKKLPRWLFDIFFVFLYLVALGLFALIIYSTIRFKPFYESASNFISNLFITYVLPYSAYLRYVLAGVGTLIIVLLIIDFFRKKPKKGDKKAELKKKIERKTKKRKLRLFEYLYIGLVVLLFLAVGIYVAYKFFGKSISFDFLPNILANIKNFLILYYPYILMGLGILVILIIILNFQSKKIS